MSSKKKAKKKAKKSLKAKHKTPTTDLTIFTGEGKGKKFALPKCVEPFEELFYDDQPVGLFVMAKPESIKTDSSKVKTVTIVAETVTYYKSEDIQHSTGKYKLECGRAAAQAGHAVSKLKASYAAINSLDHMFIVDHPITNIVLKARDTEELRHILRLADEKHLHCTEFWDDGVKTYGTNGGVLTAIALGPIEDPENLIGVSDYLPLWTCNCQH